MRAFIRHIIVTLLILVLLPYVSDAQEENVKYSMKNGFVEIQIQRNLPTHQLDSLLLGCGTSIEALDSAQVLGIEFESSLGWKLKKLKDDYIIFQKKLSDMKGKINQDDFIVMDTPSLMVGDKQVTIGRNRFKKQVVKESENLVTFFLPGNLGAKEVIISGTFNDWSTSALPMIKQEDGWSIDLELSSGKYLYKYIVDGEWVEDRYNMLTENNWHGTKDNVYFKSNYTFRLNGYPDAKRVILAGSFNGWNERQLALIKKKGYWELPVFLRDGTYTYKFIVDKKWITDPSNPQKRDDGIGNINSVLSLGNAHLFSLEGYQEASNVVVCGSFNGWNENEIRMKNTGTKWEASYVLPAGNYEYKYKVDHNWITDIASKSKIGQGDFINSVLVVNPNHKFVLSGYSEAEEVILSGSFNNWSEEGYTMIRENNDWILELHLPPGKHTYKFIVDGNWISDPANRLWEKNEFDGRNSILWVEK